MIMGFVACMGDFHYYEVGETNTNITQNTNSDEIIVSDNNASDSTKADVNIESVNIVSDHYAEYFEDMRYPKISCNGNEALDKSLKDLSTELENDVVAFNNQNKEFIGNSLSQGVTLDDWTKYSYTIDAEITRNDGKNVSILLKDYSYTGGAHPNYVLIGHTYDIYDFVKDKEELRAFLKKWVDEHQAEGLYDEAKDTIDKYIDNPKTDLETEFVIDYHIDYYLDKDELHIIFQAYELAPYAYGLIDIVLDKSLLK